MLAVAKARQYGLGLLRQTGPSFPLPLPISKSIYLDNHISVSKTNGKVTNTVDTTPEYKNNTSEKADDLMFLMFL